MRPLAWTLVIAGILIGALGAIAVAYGGRMPEILQWGVLVTAFGILLLAIRKPEP